MPYTEATVMETLRLKPFNSFGLAHSCDTDQQLSNMQSTSRIPYTTLHLVHLINAYQM